MRYVLYGQQRCDHDVSVIDISSPVDAVIEVGLNEIGNNFLGGKADAGPDRLEAALRQLGIPGLRCPWAPRILYGFSAAAFIPAKRPNVNAMLVIVPSK